MAFPTTGLIDAFAGTNGDDISARTGWGVFSTANDGQINTNRATNIDAAGAYVGNYRDDTTYGPDTEVYVTITTGDYFGLLARLVDPTLSTYDGYQLSWSGTSLTVQRKDNGSSTQLGATVTRSKSSGEKVGMEIIGDTIKVYSDTGSGWTERASRTDATYGAAGYIGWDLFDGSATQQLDDFSGGTVVDGGGGGTSILPLVACDMRNMADMGGMRG